MNTIEAEAKFTSGAYGKRDVAIVRGEGATVWDENGRSLIDCVAGIGVANVGHCHPTVTNAIAQQAQTLITAPEMVYNDQRAQLLAGLVNLLPGDLNRLFLCNSGTEAVEGAIKFARLSTGRTDVIATMRGFHGRTMGALSATWDKKYRETFNPLLPGFHHVPFDNLARMEKVLNQHAGEIGAILVEPVQGEGGVRPASPDYLAGLRQLADDHEVMLIFDEVQTGFGRTGKMFACAHYGVTPDMITLGKSLGGGVPMGGVGIGPQVTGLAPGLHGSTFGGNPLICAAALANLEVFEQEGLVQQAAETGEYLQARLREIDSPQIREVRGLGMMVGIELKTRVIPVLQALQARGVIGMPAGATVLRLLPPLVLTREQVDVVVAAIATAIAAIEE